MAREIGVSENTVRACLKELSARGHIVVEERGGRHLTNLYRIVLLPEETALPDTYEDPKPSSSLKGIPEKGFSGLKGIPEKGCSALKGIPEKPFNSEAETLQNGGEKPFSRLNPNPLVEPKEEPFKKDISPHTPHGSVQQGTRQEDHSRAFDEFWQAYPLRKAKGAARHAFDKAIKAGASAAEIIEGAKHYASERAGQDPRYTAHPTTWLNGERWTDERKPAQGVTIDQQGNVIDAAKTFERPKVRSKADEHEAMAYGAFGLRGRS
jgi:hypothetical protein